jgi:tRNA(Ile)-lysidine synthase
MLTLETFKLDWDKQFPDVRLRRSHFILAVSGGVDSIVLAHLMQSLHTKCTIAHVNFQLRGTESKRDEQFVRDFASQYNIPIQVQLVETQKYADTYKMGIQEAAREIRYAWFGKLIQDLTVAEKSQKQSDNLDKISPKPKPVVLLTAHHANDQVETILMHFFRGTGLQGLTGIPMRRNDVLNIARPLLNFSKEDIKAYAKANELIYVEDSSNEKEDYSRNFVRNTLIPQIQKQYANANENIIATSNRIREAEAIVKKAVDDYWSKGVIIRKGILTIAIKYWNKVKDNSTYTWGLIKSYGFNSKQIDEVLKILDASQGAFISSDTHTLTKWGDHIQITLNENDTEHLVIHESIINSNENNKTIIVTKHGSLHFELLEGVELKNISKESNIVYLDASKIEWPLLFRTWTATDYFYPFGLGKKKKLNHFLSDLKLGPALKKQATVLTTGNRIIWVVGKRMDDRFKLSHHTPICLKINWQDLS